MNLGADYDVSYNYDTFGRFGSINAQVAGTRRQTYTYGYLQNSDLLESLSTSQGPVVTRPYEPNRDVLTQVQNQFGANTFPQYDYMGDELARRTSVTTSGTAPSTSLRTGI